MIRRLALVLSLTLAVLACSELAAATTTAWTGAHTASQEAPTAASPAQPSPDRIATTAVSPSIMAVTGGARSRTTVGRNPSLMLLLLLLAAFVVLSLGTQLTHRRPARRDDSALPSRHRLAIPRALALRAPPLAPVFR